MLTEPNPRAVRRGAQILKTRKVTNRTENPLLAKRGEALSPVQPLLLAAVDSQEVTAEHMPQGISGMTTVLHHQVDHGRIQVVRLAYCSEPSKGACVRMARGGRGRRENF